MEQMDGKDVLTKSRALIVGDKMIVRSDDPLFSPAQIARHEAAHKQLENGEINLGTAVRQLQQQYSTAQIREMIRLYTAAYGNSGMNARQVLEEMVCDAMGKMNAFATEETSTVAGEVGQFLRDLRKAALETQTEGQKNNAQEGVKHSREMEGRTQQEITQRYQQEVDSILNMQDTTTRQLIVGYTPTVYQQLGMPSLPLTIGSGHVYSAAKTEAEAKQDGNFRKGTNYHGLGDAALKNIYKAIQDPVMVIAAKNVNKNVSPLRSTHSVVAIVDIGTAKKSLLVPIEITAERTVNGTQMDVNTISSVYERNVGNLVKEAIALENSGDVGVYYAKKEAMTLPVAGVRFPVQLQQSIASNGIIHRFSEKVNMNISENVQSQQFKRWFGDWQNDPAHASKVVNADGTPKVVYHQTDADFTIFDPRHEGAGTRDSDTPFGIFLKSSDKNIGLKGSKQMPLYVDIKNPLTVRNREQLIYELQKISDGYATELAEHRALDVQYEQKRDNANRELREYMVQWRKENPDASRTALYDDSRFNQLFNAEADLTDEWESKAREIELRSKEAITRDLEAAGYDGMIIQQDVGSFGRSTDAYIALHPEQVKSATDNIGTFDGKNPDIRYSRELDSEYMELAKDPEGNRWELQEMVNQAAEAAGYEYKRNTGRKHSPANDVPWQMFVRGVDKYQGNYGDYTYYATDKGATSIDEIMPKLRELAEEFYGETVSDEEINPPDIVMSAGVWDDMDFVQYAWDNYFEGEMDRTGKVPAVVTEDGMIVIDEDFSRVKSGDTVEYDDNGKVIPLSERFNSDRSDIRYSRELETVEALKRQNELLQEQRDYWKEQTRTTDEKTRGADKGEVRSLAGQLIRQYSSKTEVEEILPEMQWLADSIWRNDPKISYTDLQDSAQNIARMVLDGSEVNLNAENWETGQELKRFLRGRYINVDESLKEDIGDFKNFKRSNRSLHFRENGTGTGVDSLWLELQNDFGKGLFPDSISNPGDQIRHIADTLTSLTESDMRNPYAADMELTVEQMAADVMARAAGVNRQKATKADQAVERATEELNRLLKCAGTSKCSPVMLILAVDALHLLA